ncbi:MAG: MFS transporter [Bryobacterales bacterium]|nr:MFS transporter [Bryobacterales bacterium]
MLDFCHRTQLAIPFALRCRERLPLWVADLFNRDLANNAERWRRMKLVYRDVAAALETAGLEFVALKGFTHVPSFVTNPRLRAQYDLDLLFSPDQVQAALDIALELGYEPLGDRGHAVDHLPTLIRKTGWEWRGDYFDPELPLALELHFRLWDAGTEGFAVPCVEEFWPRRERRVLEEVEFTSLAAIDLPGYASTHALRHLLRGDLRPSHIYEIAYFLEHNSDADFWRSWRESHDQPLRRVEAVCFAIAREWFGCRMSPIAGDEIGQLQEPVRAWLAAYANTPMEGFFHPHKDELWLHLSLLDPGYSRFSILRRRLLPLQLPGPVDAVHLPDGSIGWRVRLRGTWRYLLFLASRTWRHTRALTPTLASGAMWAWERLALGAQFWSFFAASAFFDFGLFIFFLLFNLYLLKLGYNESFLGLVSGCMLAGSVAGSLPAGVAIERLGVRGSMLACFSLIPCLAAILAAGLPAPGLLAFAFLYGAVSVTWAVLLSPAVAGLTNPGNRSVAFSIVCASGIAIGVLGGGVGGRLPGWIARFAPGTSVTAQYRAALWIGCGIVLLGLVPAFRLPSRATPLLPARDRPRLRRPPPAVIYFLAAAVVWNLGTGVFNPFFSAFFERLHMPVERIGLVFSLSQLAQAFAILGAPLVFRVTGLIRGISRMQLLSAAALACIAVSGGQRTAALGYGVYMALQNMSEPGMLRYLMDCVPESERSGVSALNFLVASSAQAVAAAASGLLLRRFGYPPVLMLAAVLCTAAGILFRLLLANGRVSESGV